MNWMQRLKRVFHIDIEHCGVCGGTLRVIACIATPLKCRSRSEFARSSRGSSLISPPARPAPSTTPAHRRSLRAPRNLAPPITDHLLTAPTGAPRPRCASPAALRPTPLPDTLPSLPAAQYLVTSTAKRLRSHRQRTRQRPHFLDHTATPPTTQIGGLFCLSLDFSQGGNDYGGFLPVPGVDRGILSLVTSRCPGDVSMPVFEDDRWYVTSDSELLLLGSPNALAQRRTRGEGPRYHRIGRRILYRGSDLNRFLEECAVEPTAHRGGPVRPESVSDPGLGRSDGPHASRAAGTALGSWGAAGAGAV